MKTSIRALLFDFDGLILDTESPEVEVWKRIYAEYGFEYPMQLWSTIVGTWDRVAFEPAQYLHDLANDSLDVVALRERHREESDVLIAQEPVGAGIEDYMTAARRMGIRLGIASSSPRAWVEPHLARLGLASRFDCLITSDLVAVGRTKPRPDLYLKALDTLGVTAEQAIAFEDSPHGLAAARAAGIFAVAVPNPATSSLDLGTANLVVKSLASLPLEELIKQVVA